MIRICSQLRVNLPPIADKKGPTNVQIYPAKWKLLQSLRVKDLKTLGETLTKDLKTLTKKSVGLTVISISRIYYYVLGLGR